MLLLVIGQSMNVQIHNFDASFRHPSQKNRTSAEGRKYFANVLQNSSAHLVHINEANKVMKHGDPVPAHLPTDNALRIIKCRNGASNTRGRFRRMLSGLLLD